MWCVDACVYFVNECPRVFCLNVGSLMTFFSVRSYGASNVYMELFMGVCKGNSIDLFNFKLDTINNYLAVTAALVHVIRAYFSGVSVFMRECLSEPFLFYIIADV